ncbi:phenazine biosynthesis-like domain-containing protein 2 [Macrobrachium rosenbergii]|uniref:phenazine biosynthesis-like domain-containing protein 2 n=1 Tax=Macrobrachium rosenbergii TaxID=79674 RepID=UPI0034D3AF99
MQLQIFTADAFSDRPLGGNPAAVVPLTHDLDDETMLKIANELNLSETTFIRPLDDGHWTKSSRFSLKWFTPACEVPLCGHATLATAHVIFDQLGNTRDEIEFETLGGTLKVRRDGKMLVMDFPSNPPEVVDPEPEVFRKIVDACTVDLKDRVKEICYTPRAKYILVRLDDSVTVDEFKRMTPNYSEMARLHDGSLVISVGVTLSGDAQRGVPFRYHAYSRLFGTWLGVNEDPVCGSWHSVMGPYWASQLGSKDFLFRQCSSRGGDVKVSVLDEERVAIAGPAVSVITGYINI